MSDAHWYRFIYHFAAVLAAMLVWALRLDFAASLLGSFVVFFIITGIGNRRHGQMARPEDIRADIEKRFGRKLGGE